MKIMLIALCFILGLYSRTAHSAQMAVVSSAQAIIYADQNLTSPIGYVRNGRRLLVGSQARARGSVVPVVVSGRIAYVQLKDVTLSNQLGDSLTNSDQQRELEHLVEAKFEDTDRYSFAENNYFSVGLGSGTTSSFSNTFGIDNASFTELSLEVDHRPIISRYSVGVGLVYLSLREDELAIRSIRAHVNGYYSLFRMSLISAHLMAGFSLSGDLRVQLEDEVTSSGMLGLQGGAQLRILPRSRFGITLTGGYNNLFPLGFKDLNTESGTYQMGSFGGPFVRAGLVFRI
jgi:hypothetical protein